MKGSNVAFEPSLSVTDFGEKVARKVSRLMGAEVGSSSIAGIMGDLRATDSFKCYCGGLNSSMSKPKRI